MKAPSALGKSSSDPVVTDGRGPLLSQSGKALVEAMDALVSRPDKRTLTERQRSHSLAMLQKMVRAIAIDIDYFLESGLEDYPALWDAVRTAGLPVEGLSKHLLLRLLEWELEQGDDEMAPASLPEELMATPALAGHWMRYSIADRRRRDSWKSPLIAVSDLPLELQAATVRAVAGAMLAIRDHENQIERYRTAVAKVISLHREEIGIDVAAERFNDAALAHWPLDELVQSLMTVRAWPGIAALLAARLATDRATGTLYMLTASDKALAGSLAKTGFSDRTVKTLISKRNEVDRRDDSLGANTGPRPSNAESVQSGTDDPILISLWHYRARA